MLATFKSYTQNGHLPCSALLSRVSGLMTLWGRARVVAARTKDNKLESCISRSRKGWLIWWDWVWLSWFSNGNLRCWAWDEGIWACYMSIFLKGTRYILGSPRINGSSYSRLIRSTTQLLSPLTCASGTAHRCRRELSTNRAQCSQQHPSPEEVPRLASQVSEHTTVLLGGASCLSRSRSCCWQLGYHVCLVFLLWLPDVSSFDSAEYLSPPFQCGFCSAIIPMIFCISRVKLNTGWKRSSFCKQTLRARIGWRNIIRIELKRRPGGEISWAYMAS